MCVFDSFMLAEGQVVTSEKVDPRGSHAQLSLEVTRIDRGWLNHAQLCCPSARL